MKRLLSGICILLILIMGTPAIALADESEFLKHKAMSDAYIAEHVDQDEKVKLHTFELVEKKIVPAEDAVIVYIKIHVVRDYRWNDYYSYVSSLFPGVYKDGAESYVSFSQEVISENLEETDYGHGGTIEEYVIVQDRIEGYEPFEHEYTIVMNWVTQHNDWRYFEDFMHVTMSHPGGVPNSDGGETVSNQEFNDEINDEFEVQEGDDSRIIRYLTLTAGIVAGGAGMAFVMRRLKKLRMLREQAKGKRTSKKLKDDAEAERKRKEEETARKKALKELQDAKKKGNWFTRLPLNIFKTVKKLGRGASKTIGKLMDLKVASINGNKVSLFDAISYVDPTGASKVVNVLRELNKLDSLDFKTLKAEGLKKLKVLVKKAILPGGRFKEILNKISNIQREMTQLSKAFKDVKSGDVIDAAFKLSDGSYRQMSKETQTVSKQMNRFGHEFADKVTKTVDTNIVTE